MLLTRSITHKGQILEVSVYYTPLNNTVREIKSIWILACGKRLPASEILMHLFEPAINKIIDETDWREIYRAAMDGDCFGGETNGVNMNNIDKTIASFLAPHINY